MSKPKVGDKYSCVWKYDDGTKRTHIETVYKSDKTWSYLKNETDKTSHCMRNKDMYDGSYEKRVNQNCVSLDVLNLEKELRSKSTNKMLDFFTKS